MSVIIRLVISSLVICRRISANTVVYEGGSGTTGICSSPGFPSRYASNGTIVQYIFRITPSFGNATLGYIRLFFTDWYLSKYSKLTIYPDGNSSTKNYDPLDYRSRRPVAYSSGLVLLVTFISGYGDTTEKYIGFKAQYEFYPGPRNAVTDADYNYSTMGEVHDSDVNGSFVTDFSYPWRALGDYVWVIFNPEVMHLGANVTLHMDSMLEKKSYWLEVRSGPTSSASLVTSIIDRSTIVTSSSGFYVRFKMKSLPTTGDGFHAVFAWTNQSFFCTEAYSTESTGSFASTIRPRSTTYTDALTQSPVPPGVLIIVPPVILIVTIVAIILCIRRDKLCCRRAASQQHQRQQRLQRLQQWQEWRRQQQQWQQEQEDETTPSEEWRRTGRNVSYDDLTTSVMDVPDLYNEIPVLTDLGLIALPPYSPVADPKNSPPPYSIA